MKDYLAEKKPIQSKVKMGSKKDNVDLKKCPTCGSAMKTKDVMMGKGWK